MGLLVNTLAADKKYLVLNRDNFTLPIHMQLSPKKTFSLFFQAFLMRFCENTSYWFFNFCVGSLFFNEHVQLKKWFKSKKASVQIFLNELSSNKSYWFCNFLWIPCFSMSRRSLKNKTKSKKTSVKTLMSFF